MNQYTVGTPRERVFSRLVINPETGCLLWTGPLKKSGYARYQIGGCQYQVHRLMYEWFVGPIPDGLELDHLCRVRHCAAPAHLEAVTPRENQLRGFGVAGRNAAKTHCVRGHPFDAANTHLRPGGGRECRACGRLKTARYESRRMAAAS